MGETLTPCDIEIDTFHQPVDNLVILQTKGIAEQEHVNFPPFIRVVSDITANPQYYNYNIALRK
jgi:hypothetical protein